MVSRRELYDCIDHRGHMLGINSRGDTVTQIKDVTATLAE